MTCTVQKTITIEKFLNYDFREVCNIKKLVIKWGEENDECFFNLIKQSHLYQTSFTFGIKNLDILVLFYTFIKTAYFSQIDDKSFFDYYIFRDGNRPINFLYNIPYNIDKANTNNTMVVREIFRLCELFSIKLWIEIEIKDGLLTYKDD